MFYTHQDRDDDYKKSRQAVIDEAARLEANALAQRDDDIATLERIATQEDYESYEEYEKSDHASKRAANGTSTSLELRRTASNVASPHRPAERTGPRLPTDPVATEPAGARSWLRMELETA